MTEVRWQRRGLIQVPVMPEGKPGRPPKPLFWDWSNPEDVKAAHAFFNHGARDLWTREGERVYQTARKRAQVGAVVVGFVFFAVDFAAAHVALIPSLFFSSTDTSSDEFSKMFPIEPHSQQSGILDFRCGF